MNVPKDIKKTILESVESFSVRYGGDEHTIDAEVFTKTINNVIDLVKLSAHSIDPKAFLRLEIKANKEGSFETIIDAIAQEVQTIFTTDNISFAGNVIQGVLNFLLIKYHLKGKKPKLIKKTDQNTTNITNQDGKVINMPSNTSNDFFSNAKIDNCIVNIYNAAGDSNKPNLDFEGLEQNVSIEKNDYDPMQQLVVDGKNIISTINTQDPIIVELNLKKPDLLGDSAWQFVFNKVIYAKINDSQFLKKVHNGQIKTLYAGVKIKCKLKIEVELDEKLNPIPNGDKYTILEVIGDVIEPPHILKLDLKNNKNEQTKNI